MTPGTGRTPSKTRTKDGAEPPLETTATARPSSPAPQRRQDRLETPEAPKPPVRSTPVTVPVPEPSGDETGKTDTEQIQEALERAGEAPALVFDPGPEPDPDLHVANNPVDAHAPVWKPRRPNTIGGYQ